MSLRFTSPIKQGPGIIASLLKQSYVELTESEPKNWRSEVENWEQSDHNVFKNPTTSGACTFLSWVDINLVGFFCFDPRERPAYGVIGHNCILPEFRGRGYGKQQIHEIIRQFRDIGIKSARVSTNDHPFFIPAQRMYAACGFREVKRSPWNRDPKQNIIHFKMELR